MKCPICKTGNLEPDVRDVPYSYRGRTTVIGAVKGEFCDNPQCGEVVMDRNESLRTSQEMRSFAKQVNAGMVRE